MVVLDEVRIPLVGLAADESVVALESLAERPRLAVAALGDILLRNVVVLAQPEGAVAVVLEDLRDGGGLRRDTAGPAREPVGGLRDGGHAVQGVVASRQERGPCRRTQRRRVPLRVGQPVLRQPVERRHVDPAAVGRPGGESGVVVEHEQDVRCARGRLLRRERPPVGLRIADIELDGALEILVWPHGLGLSALLLCADEDVGFLLLRGCRPCDQRQDSNECKQH